MEIFNNTTKTVGDDIKAIVRPGDKLSIAAACFSIYAYQELREQLESCEELRFIFTSPTFIAEKTKAERREFSAENAAFMVQNSRCGSETS